MVAIGVLTGDIIGSSGIAVSKRKKLLATMEAAAKKVQQLLPDFKPEIFQGDSIQGFTQKKIPLSLQAALLIITMLKTKGFNIRIAIGLGTASFLSGQSLTSDGTAFQHSGRNMEVMKKKKKLIAVESDHAAWNDEWLVHTTTLNYLLEQLTTQQAAAIVEILLGNTQQTAGNTLGIRQSAVQQRLKAAAWPVIKAILERFESTV